MNKHLMIRICAAGIIWIATASCSQKNAAPETSSSDEIHLSKEQLALLEINLIKPQKKDINNSVVLNGKVLALPSQQATLSSDIEGKIESIYVLEGDYVKKGQAILTMRSMEFIELQNDYLSAKSERDFQQIEFNRQKELQHNHVGALQDFQVTQARYQAAMSKEKALRAKLEMLGVKASDLVTSENSEIASTLTLHAPIEGYIHALPISVGMLASTQTTLAEIINTKELFSVLYAYDKDIEQIKEGQQVNISFVNHNFPSVKGIVTSIERVVDNESKSINVHVKFNAPDKSFIFHDMNIQGAILIDDESSMSHAVTLSSLLKEEDNYYVFSTSDVPKDSSDKLSFKKTKVVLGTRNEHFAEITFPNEVGDSILIAENNVMALEGERKKLGIEN